MMVMFSCVVSSKYIRWRCLKIGSLKYGPSCALSQAKAMIDKFKVMAEKIIKPIQLRNALDPIEE